jgi:hypothetical protein
VTNLETAPPELDCDGRRDAAQLEVLEPRDVPLGGPRAMTVRRTLPQRRRSFIGAWCFLDHYGPDDVSLSGGMRVPPHPHTGLQTVSWLFSGEIEHRDSLGTHALVRPGELNLMTAGHGISHSEDSTEATRVLHGVQLWIVLPETERSVDPAFEHHVPPVVALPDGELRVFLGSLGGSTSPVRPFSPLLGAEVRLAAGGAHTFDLDPTFEHGVLVDSGELEVGGARVRAGQLLHLPQGEDRLTLRSVAASAPGSEPDRTGPDGAEPEELRLVVLGGVPLGERIVMWWNFIGREHEEVVAARAEWQAQLADGDGDGRFGQVPGHPEPPLPAPRMPGQRLLPRS